MFNANFWMVNWLGICKILGISAWVLDTITRKKILRFVFHLVGWTVFIVLALILYLGYLVLITVTVFNLVYDKNINTIKIIEKRECIILV